MNSRDISGDVPQAGTSLMSRMKLNDNKAGMEGLDRDKINRIILDASKGSRYFDNEMKKEEQVNKRIQEQMRKIPSLSEASIHQGISFADNLLAELESDRDLTRAIVHIDMDAYYAAVEMRDRPELHDKPMAVGGNSMLSTSNYLARRFGVRAAMPGFIAKKLCPNLVIVPVNCEKYRAVSKDIRAILSEYDSGMCSVSLDEAYLDITEHVERRLVLTPEQRTYSRTLATNEVCCCHGNSHGSIISNGQLNIQHGNAKICENPSILSNTGNDPTLLDDVYDDNDEDVCVSWRVPDCLLCGRKTQPVECITFGFSVEEAVREMRFRIHSKTLLTASAGIAPNMMLAKVCSDKNKPNGQYFIQPAKSDVMAFISDLPIRKVSGIGKVSEKMLSALGVITCRDLFNNRGLLYHLYSTVSFNYFMRICIGIGSTKVQREDERKSISVERTFSEIHKPAELYKKCYELCEALTEDLKDEQMLGKTVTLKLKLSSFEVRTRANSVVSHIGSIEQIYSAARDILKLEIQADAPKPLKLRLMGVRMSNLLSQQNMMEPKQETIKGFFQKINTRTSTSPASSPTKSTVGIPEGIVKESALGISMVCTESLPLVSAIRTESLPLVSAINAELCNATSSQVSEQVPGAQQNELNLSTNEGGGMHSRTSYLTGEGQDDTEDHIQEKCSFFGYVSHLKTDPVGLRTIKILKDHMADLTRSNPQDKNHLEQVHLPLNDDKTSQDYHILSDSLMNSSYAESSKVCLQGTSSSGSAAKISVDSDCIGYGSKDDSHSPSDEFNAKVPSSCVSEKRRAKCSPSTDRTSEPSTSHPRNPDLSQNAEQQNDGACNSGVCDDKHECPVCLKTDRFSDLQSFTNHIDECLVRKLVADDRAAVKTKTSSKLKNSKSVSDRSDPAVILVCPICHAPQRKSDLQLFNQHVDTCLNRQAIREIIHQNNNLTAKRPPGDRENPCSSKRQKTDHNSSTSTKGTLRDFFTKNR